MRAVATPGVPAGLLWGSLAGFTSFISHAGSPPFQVYVMPQNLKPRVFAGTATMFFAAVNLIKFPPYLMLGQFSRQNLTVSALLIPVAVLSTFAGVWLVRRVAADRFYAIILVITFLIGVEADLRRGSGARLSPDDRRPEILACPRGRACPKPPGVANGLVRRGRRRRLRRRLRDHLRLRKISRPVAGTRPAARLHRRHDRQFCSSTGQSPSAMRARR